MNRKQPNLPKLSAEAERSLPHGARYVYRMRRHEQSYLTLVIIIGAIMAMAIVVAVVANVLVGLSIAIVAAFAYEHFKKNAMRRILRLSYAAVTEGLCVTLLSANGEAELYVPDRLIGLRVTALGNAPFATVGNESVTALYLPSTLTTVGKDVFSGLDSLESICFEGSRDAWEHIAGINAFADIPVTYDVPYPDKQTAFLDLLAENEAETEANA